MLHQAIILAMAAAVCAAIPSLNERRLELLAGHGVDSEDHASSERLMMGGDGETGHGHLPAALETDEAGEGELKEVQELEKRRYRGSSSDDHCSLFEHIPHSLTLQGMQGEGPLMMGKGIHPAACQRMCIEATDFMCTAAMVQLPHTCFITGYRLHDDFYSSHFQRVCSRGPSCFAEKSGYSAGFAVSVIVPPAQLGSFGGQAGFCMAHCESMRTCVGFDMRKDRALCSFQEFGELHDKSFDLYLRRC